MRGCVERVKEVDLILLSRGHQHNTHRDTLRKKTSIRRFYSVFTLTAKRVRSRVESHAREVLWWEEVLCCLSPLLTTTGRGDLLT
jgi:hypothetical protein